MTGAPVIGKHPGSFMLRFFALLLLFFVSPVFAQTCASWSFGSPATGSPMGPYSSSAAACAAALGEFNSAAFAPYTFTQTNCTDTSGEYRRNDGAYSYAEFTKTMTGTCAPPDPNAACAAKMGQTTTVNFTEGYTRTTDELDRGNVHSEASGPIAVPPANGEFCMSGCKVSAETSGPNVAYTVSMVPTAQGLYRRSIDMPAQHSGVTCTPGVADSQIVKTTPAPLCPGFVGTLNGKTVCVGTAAKPVLSQDLGRSSSPAKPGNPAAGEKPASGSGSGSGGVGRTPSTGDGGNGGGPASAAVGPTGTTPNPPTGQQQLNCGAPGQPKCAIDESGMPDGVKSFDAAKTALDTTKDSAKTAIEAAQNIQTPSWTFSFQLPTGCTAYATGIKGFIMNPCQYQSTIHDLMSMVWAAVTAFCIIGMVGRTIRES